MGRLHAVGSGMDALDAQRNQMEYARLSLEEVWMPRPSGSLAWSNSADGKSSRTK
jgi:hypothetical protein